MANVFIEENILRGWADTVREKTGTTDKMLPSALLQQTQENWGTGGGSSGGGDSAETSVVTLCGFLGLPGYTSSNPIAGSPYIYVPKGTKVLSASYDFSMKTGTSTLGSARMNPGKYTPTETAAPASYPGHNKVTFKEYSIQNSSGGYALASFSNVTAVAIEIPNAYIKDNILYAGENCEGVLPIGSNLGVYATHDSLYFEGLDLRGSQVRLLPSYFGQGHTELKKIWLSEVFDKFDSDTFGYCKDWLEELHFTAITPAAVNSSYVFDSLNASCKLYVPAGTLSAYTSAANYPSATKYTYIEE